MKGAVFKRAVTLILAHEGGYVNDPQDPGGETNMGISRRSYPNEDIRGMTVERAIAIYRQDFWDRLRCDELPWPLAVQVFDMGVNAGTGTAIKVLQRSLGVTIDGVLGPKSLAAAEASVRRHWVRYARERIVSYSQMPGWARFGRAWGVRTIETLNEALLP